MSWYTLWLFFWDDDIEHTAFVVDGTNADLKRLHHQALRSLSSISGSAAPEMSLCPLPNTAAYSGTFQNH